ncbi:hypothetical protein PRIEUP_LOCUS387, partial [Pristimantis euphronides]
MVPCTFKGVSSPINRQYLTIIWEFQRNVIARYDSKGLQTQPRRYMDEKNIVEGAADLYIHNASVSDIGTYKCTVIYTPEKVYKEIDLTLYARPSISVFEKMNKDNEQDKFLCSVTGYYPEKITVELITDGMVMSDSVQYSYRNSDGTFSMNSSVILPSTEKPKSLSCRVDHESLSKPIQQNIQLVYIEDGENVGLVVGVITGAVVLIVLLVIAALVYKKKSGPSKVLVNKIHGAKLVFGERSTLYCTACNCSQETQVKWIIQHKDGATCEIAERNLGDKEEEEPLMSLEYKASTEKVPSHKRRSCHDITTKLTFLPSVSRHLGSAVTCKFITHKKSEEVTHELNDIYGE